MRRTQSTHVYSLHTHLHIHHLHCHKLMANCPPVWEGGEDEEEEDGKNIRCQMPIANSSSTYRVAIWCEGRKWVLMRGKWRHWECPVGWRRRKHGEVVGKGVKWLAHHRCGRDGRGGGSGGGDVSGCGDRRCREASHLHWWPESVRREVLRDWRRRRRTHFCLGAYAAFTLIGLVPRPKQLSNSSNALLRSASSQNRTNP